MKGDIETVVHKYELEKAFSDYRGVDAVTIVTMLVDLLTHTSFSPDKAAKKQDKLFNKLLTSTKPITKIKITRGGIEYTFTNWAIIEMFTHKIEDSNPAGLTLIELSEQTEEHFQPAIEVVRGLFNNLTYLSEKKRHLLIHELFRLAKYPFTKQQLAASRQSKAALIRNWLKRSTPKISSSTVKYYQKNYPDVNLKKFYPQYFIEHESTSKRNKKTKKSS